MGARTSVFRSGLNRIHLVIRTPASGEPRPHASSSWHQMGGHDYVNSHNRAFGCTSVSCWVNLRTAQQSIRFVGVLKRKEVNRKYYWIKVSSESGDLQLFLALAQSSAAVAT